MIGKDIGLYEKAEITSLTARMRVHIDGLLPLIKTSVVEFPNGDEVTTTLVYERLDKHCTKCLRLDHELKECLVARAEKRATQTNWDEGRDKSKSQTEQNANLARGISASSPHNDHRDSIPFQFSAANNREECGQKTTRERRISQEQREHKSHSKVWEERSQQRRHYQADERSRSYHDHPPRHHRGNSKTHYLPGPPSKGYYREIPKGNTVIEAAKEVNSSSSNHPHGGSARGIPRDTNTNPDEISKEVMEEARGEAREALLQYTKCVDPFEREVRLERAKQAEERGQLEETAIRIARRTSRTSRESHQSEPQHNTPERRALALRLGPSPQPEIAGEIGNDQSSENRNRIHASLRLGPPQSNNMMVEDQETSPIVQSSERLPAPQRLGPAFDPARAEDSNKLGIGKRKPGRPPGRKTTQERAKGPLSAAPTRRKVSRSKPSPVRRKDSALRTETNKTSKTGRPKKGETNRDSQRQGPDSTTSDNAPIINMIPRTTRRRMDFRTPSLPAP